MTNKWKVTVCSLPNYEDLVAEIYCEEFFVGLVSQETGRGVFMFEASENLANTPLLLQDVEDGLYAAKKRLLEVG